MVIYYDQVDSTNRIAKELAMEGTPPGTVVRAGKQSAGKGQYGRIFNSPVGGLYFSLLLRPDLKMEHLPLVTLATGLACRDSIQSVCNLQSQIKWPNDIYLDDKKVAGILCENVILNSSEKISPTVVIGVGLNVNNTVNAFPEEIQSTVTTLFEHLKVEVELDAFLSTLVIAIENNVSTLTLDRQSFLTRWQKFDYLANKAVVYSAGPLSMQGTGKGISPEGYYCITDDQGCDQRIIGGQLRPQS